MQQEQLEIILVQARVSRLGPLSFLDFGDFNCHPCPPNIFMKNILD